MPNSIGRLNIDWLHYYKMIFLSSDEIKTHDFMSKVNININKYTTIKSNNWMIEFSVLVVKIRHIGCIWA